MATALGPVLELIDRVPSWYRRILAGADGPIGDRYLILRSAERPWSAADIVRHVTDGLEGTAALLAGVRRMPARPGSVEETLERLAAACQQIQLLTLTDEPPTAVVDLVRRAAHEAHHHGRELELILG